MRARMRDSGRGCGLVIEATNVCMCLWLAVPFGNIGLLWTVLCAGNVGPSLLKPCLPAGREGEGVVIK
jgi:hypothetical protein